MAAPNGLPSDTSGHYTHLPLNVPSSVVVSTSMGQMQILPDDTTAGAEMDGARAKSRMADLRSLRDKITDIMDKNPIGLNPEGHYLPDSELEGLFNTDAVRSELGEDVSPTLIEYVLQKAVKPFATLLLVFSTCESREKAMKSFQNTSFTDDKFESTAFEMSSKALELCERNTCKRNNGTCLHHFPYSEPWDSTSLKDFKSKRWHFLVPKFDHRKFVYEIDSHQLLPFTTKVPPQESNNNNPSGNFSDVTCVNMLSSKQTKITSSNKTIVVALKTLKRINEPKYNIDTEWRREAKAHGQLNETRRHLIQGIAACRQIAANRQNDMYHLVLEWANGGNLLNFMSDNPKPLDNHDMKQNRERVMMVLEQLHGLADALEGMHNFEPNPSPDLHDLSPREDMPRVTVVSEPLSQYAEKSPVPVVGIQGPEDSQPGIYGAHRLSTSSSESGGPSALGGGGPVRNDTLASSSNWRHGDIKPENILRFIEGDAGTWIGILKLADLGRAQQHSVNTQLRKTTEKESWRTRWYEPPDLSQDLYDQAGRKISRLFDIWSMGCVIFEIAVWLLYGYDSVDDFLKENELVPNEQSATPYWKKLGTLNYEVSKTASRWMEYMLKSDPERDCAIGHLVGLVKDRLLKIDLPPNSQRYTEGFRTHAKDLRNQLGEIIRKAKINKNFLYSGVDRSNIVPTRKGERRTQQTSKSGSRSFLSPQDAVHRGSPVARNRWEASYDEDFVKALMRDRPPPPSESELCESCKQIDILSSQLSFAIDACKSNAEVCELCELVCTATEHVGMEDSENIVLTRSGDGLVLSNTGRKMLRLFRTDTGHDVEDVPVEGLAWRTSAKSIGEFIRLPKAWLNECDKKHDNTCAPRHRDRQLPKRLIKVENPKYPKIVDTAAEPKTGHKSIEYVAFSHKWGKMPDKAVTTAQNLEERKKNMNKKTLPESFKNAIDITHALGCNYLWIDSLCINQGPGGDFNEQADTMQTTFSGAYCVVAPCSAENATDGFLQDRDPTCVKLGNVFVCAVTNDFELDVLQSPHHRRGWVLQERALARRTLFFTKNQMYWECGNGIYCETLARLTNQETAFLGDPNFPHYTISGSSTIGSQIYLFTNLFQRYSTLEFSHPEDRPVAIDGLMDRLTEAFKTQSLAGLFHTFWGRCLLWQRAEGAEPLRKIPSGNHTRRTPPSWSWMAVTGPISFLDPKGGGFDWNDNVKLPFKNSPQSSWLKTSHLSDSNAIQAPAHDFAVDKPSAMGDVYLSYDGRQALPIAATKCVIIGSEKQFMDHDTRKHYVVIVQRTAQASEPTTYERVGVGHLLGKFIKMEHPTWISIE